MLPWNGLKNKPSPPGCRTLAKPSDDMPSLNGPEIVLLAVATHPVGVASTWVETEALSRSGLVSRFWARAEPTQAINPNAAESKAIRKPKCLSICLSSPPYKRSVVPQANAARGRALKHFHIT